MFARRRVDGTAVFLSPRRGHHLFSLLRPELVSTNAVPLSSDAFTGFGIHHAREHNAEVREATRRLLEDVIPRLVNQVKDRQVAIFNTGHLSLLLHERGASQQLPGRSG